ncbi:DNA repair complementing XP-C cells-like protein [Micractinium conductrix]|uniref:DNA repair complementing XP-C cells-like protein n=1 Tax=Micractinium conductrix TaxID=554055 RepID=A0A2P6V689_9CHLO|nr:DNA repair complementing XP-C cells-like protein [Micractinium conductrix]|eukprot:PSC69590.1 DNA repair complementing XP-C cells-like protein [Micractinium conductrix]
MPSGRLAPAAAPRPLLPQPRDSAAAAAADEEQQQQQQQQHVSVQDGDDEDWEDAWQDEEGEEEWEDAGVGGAAGATTASAAGDSEEDDGEGGGLTITFDKGDTAGDRGKRRRPASSGGEGGARRGVTKADRERAALVHRSHLLCLLARGQLFDGAASDPLLQAQLLSLVPPGPAAKLQIGGTAAAADGSSSSSSSAACSLQGLHQQLAWFRRHFKLAALGCGAAAPSGQGDLVTAALHGTRGLEGAGAALQAAVERRVAAGAEEYAALFAALLRAQGAAVRLMVALSPSSLRPTEAAKQQRAALAAASQRFGAAAQRYAASGTTAGEAAADVQGTRLQGRGTALPCLLAANQRAALGRAPAAAAQVLSGRAAAQVDALREEASMPAGAAAAGGGEPGGAAATAVNGKLDCGAAAGAAGEAAGRGGGAHKPSRGAKTVQVPGHPHSSPPAATSVEHVAAAGVAVAAQHPDLGLVWVEVFCREVDEDGAESGDARWVHADPLTGWVGRERDVEANVPRERQPLAYVVALADGGAKDVTQRYTSSWLAAEKMRDEEWWRLTLAPLRQREEAARLASAANAGASPGGSALQAGPVAAKAAQRQQQRAAAAGRQEAKLAADREDAELAEREQRERATLPHTLEGFKAHQVYVLDRHIPKHQAIRPGAKRQGLHREEAYWLRSDLDDLHTVEKWRLQGREVLPEQLALPVKRLKKRGMGKAKGGAGSASAYLDLAASPSFTFSMGEEGEEEAGDSELPDPATHSSFYGRWQTRAWAPPPAKDGKVPRNAHGNVEVPPFSAVMPAGTVHLNHPYLATVCKKLGVDYAPALTGFEPRSGRSVPRIQGVVVCAEHAEAVMEAYAEMQREKEERERRKRQEEGEAGWRTLLRASLARVRVQQAYGDGADGAQAGSGAMADAAAALLLQEAPAPRGKQRGGKQAAPKRQMQAPRAAAAAADGGGSGSGIIDLAESNSDGLGSAAPAKQRQQQGKRKRGQAQQQHRQQQQHEAPVAAHLADVKTEEI